MMKQMPFLAVVTMFVALGCDGGGSGTSNQAGAPRTPPPQDAGANRSDEQAHDGGTASGSHGGPIIELGSATIGPFTVRASRDQGEINPGGDAPIDVWLTPAPETSGGDLSKLTAVRFWIGSESGVESVKAKASIENPSEPNHWHTHAEVPSPLPQGSRLWVEIEVDGRKHVGSFDLKM